MKKKLPILLTALLLFAGLTFGTGRVSADPGTDPLNIAKDTVVSNVYYDGHSLSGMTLEEAVAFCEKKTKLIDNCVFMVQSAYKADYLYGGNRNSLGITWDTSGIRPALEAAVLKGSLLDRYKFAKDYQASPVTVEDHVSVNMDTVRAYFNPVADAWYLPPVDATVSYMTGAKTVTPSQDGLSFNFENGLNQLYNDVMTGNLPENGEYYFSAGETLTLPRLSTEQASGFTIIGSAVTQYHSPSSQPLANREQNLITSTSNMNGSVFAPGEIVSALTMYGPVTPENGYYPAGTIGEGGVHVDEYGGGICQTTTTLYNAALMAELEIVYRHNHSKLVDYIDPGLDAMVYAAGNSDFRFKNSSSDFIVIESYVNTSDLTVHVNIIGHEDHDPGHSVAYVSVIDELVLPAIAEIPDPTRGIGWKNPENKYTLAGSEAPICGCKAHVMKITNDNGVMSQTLFTGTDTYSATNASYYVSPDIQLNPYADIDSRATLFVSFKPSFINGTSLSADPKLMTYDELCSFNASMGSMLTGKGYAWPYTNGGYSDEDPDYTEGEPVTPPEEDPGDVPGGETPPEEIPAETPAP